MGNCSLTKPGSKYIKVIFPSGETRRLHEPTKAAELMLECPNSFLVNAQSIQVGKRFDALNADEDLEIGHMYVIFSMKRLNAFVGADDVSGVFAAVSSGKRGTISSVRVSPECVVNEATEVDELMDEFCSLEFRRRLSKKPLLETIVEERNTLLEIMMLD